VPATAPSPAWRYGLPVRMQAKPTSARLMARTASSTSGGTGSALSMIASHVLLGAASHGSERRSMGPLHRAAIVIPTAPRVR
jgi:hypothetical protein